MEKELRIQVEIRLYHSNVSTGPAFLITMSETLSSSLTLTSYDVEATEGLLVVSKSELSNSLLSFEIDVFPLEEEFTVTYQALIDPDKVERNITDEVVVHYATIKQEGIGLLVWYNIIIIKSIVIFVILFFCSIAIYSQERH